jgi:hypothetical protein
MSKPMTGAKVQELVQKLDYDLQVTYFNSEEDWLKAAQVARDIEKACKQMSRQRKGR